MKRVVISLSLAALALGLAGVTSAQSVQEVVVAGSKASGAEVRSQTVHFGDLDLSKSEGVATLLTRIRAAAGNVCSPPPDASDFSGNIDYKRCVGHAVSGAVETVSNPRLTAMASRHAH